MINQEIINIIEKCLIVAEKHGGYTFGGYVRDVLIPRSLGQYVDNVQFKDVNIWFKTHVRCQNFIEEMGSKLKKGYLNPKIKEDWSQYNVEEYYIDSIKVNLDLIVSQKIPINDVNINLLTYRTDGTFISEDPDYLVESLIDSWKQKTLKLLYPYIELLHSSENRFQLYERLENLYLNQGWSMLLTDKDGNDIHVNKITDIHEIVEDIFYDPISYIDLQIKDIINSLERIRSALKNL